MSNVDELRDLPALLQRVDFREEVVPHTAGAIEVFFGECREMPLRPVDPTKPRERHV
ncbi:hypothetical protein [Streptomyces diastaticus]|uniref:hypothetical protein n=1 Tax=Streptomyces diastaticus TaxID=1956 RepID=UPI003665A44B